MSKISKAEAKRGRYLEHMQQQGEIKALCPQPVFLLACASGKLIATYTADFAYVLCVDMYDLKAGDAVIEEFKGSKNAWSAKRRDYKLKLKWASADYPGFKFIENLNGDIQHPRFIWPKKEKYRKQVVDKSAVIKASA